MISKYLKKFSHSVQVHTEKYSLSCDSCILIHRRLKSETRKMSVPFECFCKSSLPVSTLQRPVCNCFHCSSEQEHVVINKKYIKKEYKGGSVSWNVKKTKTALSKVEICTITVQWQPVGELDQGIQVIWRKV